MNKLKTRMMKLEQVVRLLQEQKVIKDTVIDRIDEADECVLSIVDTVRKKRWSTDVKEIRLVHIDRDYEIDNELNELYAWFDEQEEKENKRREAQERRANKSQKVLALK